MKISYLITCSTETDSLQKLLNKIHTVLGSDELVILQDSNFNNEVVNQYPHVSHNLNNDYGAHKSWGIQQCSGDFIFAIDGDELPPDSLLGDNLHALIESNPTIEAYVVPRINDFVGVTAEHAKQWGWHLTHSPGLKRPIVNFPDGQWRIFKRDYPRISFKKRLHEKIEGYKTYSPLPALEEYALYHFKTIEKQVETNLRYNKMFSEKENMGS